MCVVVKNWDNPLNRAGEENMVHPRNHHMTYTSIIICGHKHKIEINEAEEKQPRWSGQRPSAIWDIHASSYFYIIIDISYFSMNNYGSDF